MPDHASPSSTMPGKKAILSFYSYDSTENPWCGGGGAYRDFETLARQRKYWDSITLYVGRYPGFVEKNVSGIRIRPLGWGSSHLVSRVTFTLWANLHLLFNRKGLCGNAVSINAPVFTGLFFPEKFYGVIHHLVEKQSFDKFGILGWVPYLAEKIIFRGIRRLISSNKTVCAKVKKINPQADILVSANGFDPALLTLTPVTPREPYILFVGRFDIYMKGLDSLITAFGRLARPELKLIIAGKASERRLAEAKQLVETAGLSGKVILHPNISNRKKKELLSSCLFFCSPSRFEGWGIAALEANAAGKAVVVTETEGFTDSISRDFSGLFVPVGDMDALTAAMKRLVKDEALRKTLEGNARTWAARFSWDTIAENEFRWINGFYRVRGEE